MKLCLFCKKLSFYMGTPDYSDMTPGESASIDCSKSHWNIYFASATEEEYRKALETAATCEDFDPRPEYKEA